MKLHWPWARHGYEREVDDLIVADDHLLREIQCVENRSRTAATIIAKEVDCHTDQIAELEDRIAKLERSRPPCQISSQQTPR